MESLEDRALLAGVLSVAAVPANVAEGTAATFEVSLSEASSQTVTADYVTVQGSATENLDYQGASGTLTFAPGETLKTVSVPTLTDSEPDPSETFSLRLTKPGLWLSGHTEPRSFRNSKHTN